MDGYIPVLTLIKFDPKPHTSIILNKYKDN